MTPNADLPPHDFVRVDGAGYSDPDALIWICQTLLNGLENVTLDCTRPHGGDFWSLPTRHPSDAGTFSASIHVYRFVDSVRLGRTIDCAVERCAVGAIVNSGTAAYAPISFAPGLADGRVKRRSDAVIFGDDAYRAPPIEIGDVSSQVRSHAIEPGGYWTYALQVQNDGLVTEDLAVTASVFPSSPGLPGEAKFFYGYYDVTSYVLGSGGFPFTALAPGAVRTFAVQFHVPADTPAGAFVQATVKFRTASGTVTDEVNVNAQVPG